MTDRLQRSFRTVPSQRECVVFSAVELRDVVLIVTLIYMLSCWGISVDSPATISATFTGSISSSERGRP